MFTGFKAYCVVEDKEVIILEQNNYHDIALNRVCATNWHQVDKTKLKILELWWNDQRKAYVEKPEGAEWVFFHSGSISSSDPKPIIISRTIGYKSPSHAPWSGEDVHYWTVEESTGILSYRETVYIPKPKVGYPYSK